MRKLLILFIIASTIKCAYAQKNQVKKEFESAGQQVSYMIGQLKGPQKNNLFPRTIEGGKLKPVSSDDWTSGFFPGELWFLYEYTGDKKWLDNAKKYTEGLEREQFNTRTHDLGFMIYCSYGNGYRLTGDPHYKSVIIRAAKSLSSRFNKKVGVIKSWDHHQDIWSYPVIIDNMMNLELLFAATTITGDSSYYKIAVSHADQTLKNHFRADYSSYHVVDYDTTTSKVIKKTTHQGFSDESAWARGQAWALYGFTTAYRETKKPAYLNAANKIAAFILKNPNMPQDKVPYWDFNDPDIPNAVRDASAAAIISSALYQLAQLAKNPVYVKDADAIMSNLRLHYKSAPKANSGFILDHSTGHKPYKSEIDVPIIYADYYYMEALLKRSNIN